MAVLEGGDIFAQDFINMEKNLLDSEAPSPIQKFFTGTSVFVTGCTGFLGQVLLEKLLRSCWGVSKVFVIVRKKKEKSPNERMEEIFQGPLFKPLTMVNPDFRKKIVIMPGDCSFPDLGLSPEDIETLLEEVGIVFHSAATVRFDEEIRTAVRTNINGTRQVLEIAKKMKRLKSFVHVSTAYSHCPRDEIDEKFYKPPMHPNDISSLVEMLSNEQLNHLTPELIKPWPNTYTYTKAISESLIMEFAKKLPIGVMRPVIVTSTAYEPISGWINNFYGPQGVAVGAATGFMRTLYCNPDSIADMIPVDMVINGAIALAWDVGQTKGDNPNFEKINMKDAEEATAEASRTDSRDSSDEDQYEVPILNLVSSETNPLIWGQFMDMCMSEGEKMGSMVAIWYCCLTLNSNFYVDQLYQLFLHFIPAYIVDFVSIILQRPPRMVNGYKKIRKFSKVITYFCTTTWKFHDRNAWQLWNKMSENDKRIFNFNIAALDWKDYLSRYIRGLRVFLTADDLSTAEAGRKRFHRFKILHYTTLFCFWTLFVYGVWRILSKIFLT